MQNLDFACLESALKEQIGLKSFNLDTLKTLNLYSDESGYNNAASLLADKNDFPGVDTALFGESTSIILRRVISENQSILSELDETLQIFEDSYCYEEIVGARRETVERIPLEAFREAIANAFVHREWDISAHIRVAMYSDRIEITSPGGLPAGISEEEYLSDAISIRRNPILANVLYRLNIIEAFGTGIHKIKAAYAKSVSKPQFSIGDNTICVMLPVIKADLGLAPDQELVYGVLSSARVMASSEIHEHVSFSRSKLNGILKELISLGLAETTGVGRGLKYRRSRISTRLDDNKASGEREAR